MSDRARPCDQMALNFGAPLLLKESTLLFGLDAFRKNGQA
jgi:hypothetical protein